MEINFMSNSGYAVKKVRVQKDQKPRSCRSIIPIYMSIKIFIKREITFNIYFDTLGQGLIP